MEWKNAYFPFAAFLLLKCLRQSVHGNLLRSYRNPECHPRKVEALSRNLVSAWEGEGRAWRVSFRARGSSTAGVGSAPHWSSISCICWPGRKERVATRKGIWATSRIASYVSLRLAFFRNVYGFIHIVTVRKALKKSAHISHSFKAVIFFF